LRDADAQEAGFTRQYMSIPGTAGAQAADWIGRIADLDAAGGAKREPHGCGE